MNRVYSSPDRAMVYHIKNVLENHGIESTVHGEDLAMGVGMLTPFGTWIELRLVDEGRLEDARQIIRDTLRETQGPAGSWSCGNCGEDLGEQFVQCWKCGMERPA